MATEDEVQHWHSTVGATNNEEQVMKLGCDRWPLHYACRVGNLEQVQYLVDVLNARVNEADAHDATPLYLAALTGRKEICRFLLERGARCDPTGDAARVFYVALTPELRNLLREWSLTAASRDPFLDLLRKSFNDITYADCYVQLEEREEVVYLHRAMLYARCPRLLDSLVKDGDLVRLELPSILKRNVLWLSSLLEFLYTGNFEVRDYECAQFASYFAEEYDLDIIKKCLRVDLDQYESKAIGKFRCTVADRDRVKHDMTLLVPNLAVSSLTLDNTASMSNGSPSWGGDLYLVCHGQSWRVHKFIVCAHSDYFTCALSGGFKESTESSIDFSGMVTTADVIQYCIRWMYTDRFFVDSTSTNSNDSEKIAVPVAVELLDFASAILCPRLSAYTATAALIPALSANNVFDMLALARTHGLERLEEKCVEFIAFNLEALADSQDLKMLFQGEVTQIEQQGDLRVNDVPIAAEIRSNLQKAVEQGVLPSLRGAQTGINLMELLQVSLQQALHELQSI